MLKKLIIGLTMIAFSSTAAMACTPEDVEARQVGLIGAIQMLVAVDPAKAQAIVAKIQMDMDQAAADGDEAATCVILDEALAAAQGQ